MTRFISRFSTRLIISFMLVQALTLPVLLYALLKSQKNSLEEEFIQNTLLSSYLIRFIVEDQIDQNRTEETPHFLEDMLLNGTVTYAELKIGSGGTIAGSTGTSLSSLVFREDDDVANNEDSTYFFSTTIAKHSFANDPDTGIYNLRLGFSEESLQSSIRSSVLQSNIIVLCYFFISLFVTYVIANRTVRPIDLLRKKSHRVANGNFHETLDINSKVFEVQELANDLERMRDKLVQNAKMLEHLSLHDALTGLPNRSLINDRLDQALLESSRSQRQFCILMLDLNGFKHVNDSLGHHIGDIVLKKTAKILIAEVRPYDTVARLGGDEFVVYLKDASIEVAKEIAERIQDALHAPILFEGKDIRVQTSIGITCSPIHGEDKGLLMQKADAAMYHCKEKRLRYVIFSEELLKKDAHFIELSADLVNAIKNRHLVLHYQPKIDLTKNGQKIIGVEALVRWNHPRSGLLYPDRFIHIAEKSGLMNELTLWVIEKALTDTRSFYEEDDEFSTAINISALNLLDHTFVASVNDIIRKLNISPSRIQFELTETEIMNDPVNSIDALQEFFKEGIRIAIDDFGTGYSSLSYLKELPISSLKIDKSFITNIIESEHDKAIVRATIDMAHHLGIKVIAEGVESYDCMKLLQKLNADSAQGWYIGEPMSIGKLKNWITLNHRFQAGPKLIVQN